MKQKVILAVLALIFLILLAVGLVLSVLDGGDSQSPATTPVLTSGQTDALGTTPAETTPAVTQPGETVPDATTPAATTPTPTTPASTTAPATTPAATTPPVTTPAPTTPATTTPPVTTPAPTTPATTTPPETTPAPTTPAATTPPVTTPAPTTPAATTPPVTTPAPTTPAATTPPETTPEATAPSPTTPQHTHSYATKVTAPTLTSEGYTVYTCECGHSYVGDNVAKLTLEQYINQLPLNPNSTGVSELDKRVQAKLTGDSTYGKLLSVHNYLRSCGSAAPQSSLSQMSAFAGKKVFKHVAELKFAYDANQMFANASGAAEHSAAAFAVAARALGLEAYVTSGSLNGRSHIWTSVRLGEQLYYFDAFGGADVFAKLPGEVPGYGGAYMGNQSGFQSAGEFVITLSLRSNSGSTTRKYTWSVDKAGKGNDDFLQNTTSQKLSGKVSYTITVTASYGDVIVYDHTGMPKVATELSGELLPAAGTYTLLVEEQASGRSFLISIDN